MPYFEVTFLNFEVKKGSKHYNKAFSNLKSWNAVIKKILNSNKTQYISKETESSLSDELIKLHELYQKGILSEDEFKQAKQKIFQQ